MTDAQNERTKGRSRRRGRRRGNDTEVVPVEVPVAPGEPSEDIPVMEVTQKAPVTRPKNLAPPTVRSEEYCIHHMANFTDCEPMQVRTNMTTVRHLRVDHFGEATLFCDCLHNGSHEWPPSMQILETAIELDQFVAASTSEA